MPHADEALKSLIARLDVDPVSSFVELAATLLSRGHAAEALRVAEHGLQFVPGSADGRAERAAALLGLGRPRVAYVELCRALAINPRHRRALRLLGRTYKDAGVPGKAAELLAQRLSSSDIAHEMTPSPPPRDVARHGSTPIPSEPSTSLDPNLFSNLTVDLGLGGAVPEPTQRRIEITQIIRQKGKPRPPRSASELEAIDGPIVDTTHPHQNTTDSQERPSSTHETHPLAPLWELTDEPLFNEATPFEVRPVALQDTQTPKDEAGSDTVIDSIASNAVTEIRETRSSGPVSGRRPPALAAASEMTPLDQLSPLEAETRHLKEIRSNPRVQIRAKSNQRGTHEELRDTPKKGPKSGHHPKARPLRRPVPSSGYNRPLKVPVGPQPRTNSEEDTPLDPRAPTIAPLTEIDSRAQQRTGRGRERRHLVVGLLGAAAIALYLIALVLLSIDEIAVWWAPERPETAQQASP